MVYTTDETTDPRIMTTDIKFGYLGYDNAARITKYFIIDGQDICILLRAGSNFITKPKENVTTLGYIVFALHHGRRQGYSNFLT